MEPHAETPAERLRRLVNGYQVSQAIHVAATLGVADRLRAGPQTSAELAAAVGAHAPTLYRLLRALASVGVFREEAGGRFGLTPLGECLCADAPESVAAWAAFIGQPYYWQAWAHLLFSVRTGANAFRHVHGTNVWGYRQRDPEAAVVLDRAMTELTRLANAAVLAAYDFGRFGCVVDVGGGQGALLAAILERYPALQGVLFDQPHVVSGAEPVLRAAGVADRCRVVGGSFFDAVPAGGDAYLLKSVLHDWADEPALAILRNCRRAVAADGTLLVIERLVGPLNEDPGAKFSDLNMLVSPGGQERTRAEYAALLAAAGFQLVDAIPTASGLYLIVGRPV